MSKTEKVEMERWFTGRRQMEGRIEEWKTSFQRFLEQ
jgi:hypothetical protein